ncbi:MAG: CRISPR-associated RAMP protein Csx10 [Candidatus Tectimicrobiota bacterium]|nr:MAG: CRISPR-associated RAMP protein Csx10 [Candidatus Tectomicrobia bacterium]
MICRYLPYTLTLHAPAVLTALGGDPNSSRTLPFIPGSAIRGAAARALGDPGTDPQRLRTFRALILDGSVRFLNAYPRVAGRRALPTPVSLRVDKTAVLGPDGELEAWDLAAFAGVREDDENDWPEVTFSPVPEPFVTISAAQPVRVGPARGSRIHQQRDRQRGRAWKDPTTEEPHGTIFVFEFLEAGQEFDGLVQVFGEDEAACEALERQVKAALEPPILIGRSRRGGYGGDATISWAQARDREVIGQGLVGADLPAGRQFRAVLTSPYIGRDPHTGQLDPSRFAEEIVERLRGRARIVRRRWSFDLAGGFNRKWRLEIPQALACAAGSVLVLETTKPIRLADLLEVEHSGLGERRVDGFGRLTFLEAPSQRLVLRVPSPTPVKAPAEGEVPELVRFAEARIVDAAVERAIREEAARLARSATRIPTPSLLGRLRNAMRPEPETALATIRTWLGHDGPSETRLRRPALDQLERCRLDKGQRLSDWLREMAATDGGQQLAETLRLDALVQRFHIISEATAREHLGSLELSLRARFIDNVLAALSRTKRQRRSS